MSMPPSLCFPLAFVGGPALSCREARGHKQEKHLSLGRSGLGLLLPAFLLLAGSGSSGKKSTDQKEMGLIRGLLYLSLADFGSSYSVWRHCLLILLFLGGSFASFPLTQSSPGIVHAYDLRVCGEEQREERNFCL